jgi:hypothetical protein
MKTYTINVTTNVPTEQVQNAIISAIEGEYSPWLLHIQLDHSTTPPEPNMVWYGQLALYDENLVFTLLVDDPEAESDEPPPLRVKITSGTIKSALTLMATNYPRHFADLINENDDAITADVLLQLMVYKDVIYG